jgi:hypothetical protein
VFCHAVKHAGSDGGIVALRIAKYAPEYLVAMVPYAVQQDGDVVVDGRPCSAREDG